MSDADRLKELGLDALRVDADIAPRFDITKELEHLGQGSPKVIRLMNLIAEAKIEGRYPTLEEYEKALGLKVSAV